MERITSTEVRSAGCGEKTEENGVEYLRLGEEIHRLIAATAAETGSSFTSLLELPANQAMELLHSPETDKSPTELPSEVWSNNHRIDHHTPYSLHSLNCAPTFPSNTALLKRFSRLSAFPAAENSPETSSIPSNSNENSHKVKQEPVDSDSNTNSSDLMVQNNNQSRKRREREKKAKWSKKKSKSVANETSDDCEKLPYIHVRARRGQATDSHSLAERARREKINARMKLLQELVPGCTKISGTAMVLDEIINHVQSLQRQVEFLSMRLAAVNTGIDFNLDRLLAAESGSPMDGNFPGMVMPLMRPEGLVNGNRQQYQQLWHLDGLHQPVWGREDNHHVITPENSLLSSFNKFSISVLKSAQNGAMKMV